MASTPQKARSKTSSVSIGRDRYEKLESKAIALSFETQLRINCSHIIQHLMDNYLEVSVKEIKEKVLTAKESADK